MTPGIVVCAFNRPPALRRLLASLARAAYPAGENVRLIISIDRGPDGIHPEVRALAEAFTWPHGSREVICQPERLGLVRHVFFCCGLSRALGEVIFLEDDLVVSPVFHSYAAQALDFYCGDDRVAGLSLYALWFNGYTQEPFIPLPDGADAFFLGVPYTQGQAFTARQWQGFEAWRAAGAASPARPDRLHDSFSRFQADDWFPLLAAYCADTGRFTVYPRVSLTTGAGDAGTHFSAPSVFFQNPLQYAAAGYRFHSLDQALAVYDGFFEILPDRLCRLAPDLRGLDFDVDLYATKAARHLRAEHVLTTRPCRGACRSFGRTMWPMEANVIEGVPGNEICLCQRQGVRWDAWAGLVARQRAHAYFTRRRRMSRTLRLKFQLVAWMERLRGER